MIATINKARARLAFEMANANTWDEYRRRRNLVWFAFLGYVPVCFIVAVLSMRLMSLRQN